MIRQPCSQSDVCTGVIRRAKHPADEGVSRNVNNVNPLWPRYAFESGQASEDAEAYTDGEEREAAIGLSGVRRDGACRQMTLGTERSFRAVRHGGQHRGGNP